MAVIDFVILGVLLFNGIQGVRRGLIRIIMDIVAIAGSILLSLHWHSPLITPIQSLLNCEEKTAAILALVILWAVFFFIFMSIGKALDMVFSGSFLGSINRLGGLFLGLLKGLVFVMVIAIPIIGLNLPVMEESLILKTLQPSIEEFSTTFFENESGNILPE